MGRHRRTRTGYPSFSKIVLMTLPIYPMVVTVLFPITPQAFLVLYLPK